MRVEPKYAGTRTILAHDFNVLVPKNSTSVTLEFETLYLPEFDRIRIDSINLGPSEFDWDPFGGDPVTSSLLELLNDVPQRTFTNRDPVGVWLPVDAPATTARLILRTKSLKRDYWISISVHGRLGHRRAQ